MIRKLRNIRIPNSFMAMIWAVVMVVVYFALVSAVELKRGEHVSKTDVVFVNGYDQQHLLSKNDIKEILVEYFGSNLENVPVRHIETDLVEDLIRTTEYVLDAEVYVDKLDVLHIDVEERVPVWRVFRDGTSFYIDDKGVQMPLSDHFAARVPVVIDMYKDDEQYSIQQALKIYEYTRQSTFYRALIDQMVIDEEGRVTVRPLLGMEKIEMGKLENIEEQLEKYEAFYSQFMAEEGWNKYERFDLTVPKQVRTIESKKES